MGRLIPLVCSVLQKSNEVSIARISISHGQGVQGMQLDLQPHEVDVLYHFAMYFAYLLHLADIPPWRRDISLQVLDGVYSQQFHQSPDVASNTEQLFDLNLVLMLRHWTYFVHINLH